MDTAVKVADGWRLRGRWADGVALLHGVQPAARELGATAGARVLVALARMLNDQSMFAGVRQVQERAAVLDEALALAQQADDPALLGEAWAVRGMALHTDFLPNAARSRPVSSTASSVACNCAGRQATSVAWPSRCSRSASSTR